MRKSVFPTMGIVALTLIAMMSVTALPTPAAAAHALGQNCKSACLESHCKAAGGSFVNKKGMSTCGTDGGNNVVTCNNKTGKCYGTDPQRVLGGGGGKNGPVAVGGSKQTGPASGTTGTGAGTPVSAGGSKEAGGNKKH